VEGSGTATAEAEFTTAEPVAEGSKMKIAFAPTVRLDPSAMAVLEARISVPSLTNVPPV